MARRPQYRALAGIDRKALAEFQAGIRKRYTDEQILEELAASAKRLGRSPTMREFAADPETSVHPQTVIEHFGSWNQAKRTLSRYNGIPKAHFPLFLKETEFRFNYGTPSQQSPSNAGPNSRPSQTHLGQPHIIFK